MLKHERQHWQEGIECLAGVDEAGRGPLAGPVMAAAVVIDPVFAEAELEGAFKTLTDSKKLTRKRRDEFFALLNDSPEIRVGVGSASVTEIDELNILRATHLAMRRAVEALGDLPEHVLVDGLPVEGLPCGSTSIVSGDSLSLLIAAASIMAKVTRDELMDKLDLQYPEYGFAKHKGYGTKVHMEALKEYGPCPAHRRSFKPVRDVMM